MKFTLPRQGAALLFQVGRLWGVDPLWLQAAASSLASLASEQVLGFLSHASDEGAEEAPPKPYHVDEDGIADFAITGPMSKGDSPMAAWFARVFGGTATADLARRVQAAAEDPDVKGAFVKVNSPGGQVDGNANLVDALRAFAQAKPLHAYGDGQVGSCAYWAASQAHRITTSRDTWSGSIGVYIPVEDSSKAAEAAGIEVKVIASGPYKGAGYPGTEVTEEQEAMFQREVDASAAVFVEDALIFGRGMSAKEAARHATGEAWMAPDALKRGLIDAVGTEAEARQALRDAIARKEAGGDTDNPNPDGGDAPGAVTLLEVGMDENKKKGILAMLQSIGAMLTGGAAPGAEDEAPATSEVPAPIAAPVAPAAPVEDPAVAGYRAAVAEAYATEYNRVYGAGSMTQADALKRVVALGLDEVREETSRMIGLSNALLAPDPTDETAEGRQSADEGETGAGISPDADAAAEAAKRLADMKKKNLAAMRDKHGI